jgi:nitronate monooxygenase
MPDTDIVAFLNLMLTCERAGAKALRHFEQDAPPPPLAAGLPALFADETRYCADLSRHIRRLDGEPTGETGAFLDKILAAPDWPARLDLLIRGQAWVARKIAETLPVVEDPPLRAFLEEMHQTHLINVAAVEQIAGRLVAP